MQKIPTLEITAEFGGSERTGRFELGPVSEGNWSIVSQQRTGTLVSGAGQTLDQLSRLLDEVDAPSGSIQIASSGQQVWEVTASVPSTMVQKDNGDYYQWGSSPEPSQSPHSATGQDALSQVQKLGAYFRRTVGDSLAPAMFRWGHYSESGDYAPVPALVENPQQQVSAGAVPGPVELTIIRVTDVTNPGSIVSLKG